MHIYWDVEGLIERLFAWRPETPFPVRTVIVPNGRVAHVLRRALARHQRGDVLAGTRFSSPVSLAAQVLREASVHFIPGEESLRTTRLRVLFDQGLAPDYFGNNLLKTTRGWDEAFARTIADLERAALRPDDLSTLDAPAAHGVKAVWAALDEAAGCSWTNARMLIEAAARLEATPRLWPYCGPVLAVASGYTSGAKARFLGAIPEVEIALRAARPLREPFFARVERYFGKKALHAMVEAIASPKGATDRDILATYLFEPPEVQSDPQRPRAGAEPDGTLRIEEYAGVEAEIEAAAAWVAREVLERRTPLEEIAVLLPTLDPLAHMLKARIERLSREEKPLPSCIAGGVPLLSTAAGARILTVIRALRGNLSADLLADVLPVLRTTEESYHVPRNAAMDLAYSFGTLGGGPSNPAGALAWRTRAAEREAAMAAALSRIADIEGSEEQLGLARGVHDLKRLLRDLRAIRPALEELVKIAAAFIGGKPLSASWPAVRDFLAEWVLTRGEGPRADVVLDQALQSACADLSCGSLCGEEALARIETELRSLRFPTAGFGEPAVYIGTIAGSTGLSFKAVRIIGLAEGSVPVQPREDPVLPEALRQELGVETAADHVLASLHDLGQVVRDTEETLALSAPRLTLERSYHEPSSVLLEAAAALGRPDPDGGTLQHLPDTRVLRRTELGPARRLMQEFRLNHPIGEAAWLERVAKRKTAIPGAWQTSPALDLARIAALLAEDGWGAMDGALEANGLGPNMPGLSPERPISASRLKTLLECPHHFLYEHIFGWQEPASARSQGELDALAYGSLFHAVAERFYATHGSDFAARRQTLAHWQSLARELARLKFDALLEQYPLAGDAVRRQQFERLRREFEDLLEYEWRQGAGTFLATEKPFGYDAAVPVQTAGNTLYLRGFIDLIDVVDGTTRIRDLKTGTCVPRQGKDASPHPVRDLQLAVYAAAMQRLARQWGVPARLGVAYLHSNDRKGRERAFKEDFDAFAEAARSWFETAATLLTKRIFPRTPVRDDCSLCPFQPVCGPGAQDRAAELLAKPDRGLAAFRDLKD